MQLLHTVTDMQARAGELRRAGRRVALVPTMGALHEGHLALVREARRRADDVVVSIFVNPTQFGPGEDFERYPRTLDDDLEALRGVCGDAFTVFAPSGADMYPDGPSGHRTWVDVEELSRHLCGGFREGHFRGVTTVVAKLFLACRPHVAVFGLKDAQQYLLIRRMVRDLNFGVDVVGVPTVREPDGLALSSRNRYLDAEQRAQAVVVPQAVEAARRRVEEGEQHSEALVETMRATLAQAPGARVQYAEMVDVDTVQPVERIAPGQQVLAAVAVFFGDTRLIDNAFVRAPA